ncbi:thiamine phosphate synthase [Halobacillus hunanensis]|uniref:thiamine phosphate synthase n=1 Tax=Halobacillus hunanensis TaxID=578214 RepID=UPI00159185B4|nr:thiamine phosphate synthase [Halobacillus hunanensis]
MISNGIWPVKKFVDSIAPLQSEDVFVHFREKQKPADVVAEGINDLQKLGFAAGRIVANDRVDLACCLGIGGVQLSGQGLRVWDVRQNFPDLRIGKSVHSIGEAEQAECEGADYVMFGHIFPTLSKKGKKPQGLQALHELTSAVKVPVIAVGGIKPRHMSEIKRAGAAGAAVISGLLEADNVQEKLEEYKKGRVQ